MLPLSESIEMRAWIRFRDQVPSMGEFIAAITHRGLDLPADVWEKDLEKNAVGVWIDGAVWEGDTCQTGFTHWTPLPERPSEAAADLQLPLWDGRPS